MQRRLITRIAGCAAAAIAAAGVLGLATPAGASDPTEPPSFLSGQYPAAGSTHIKKSNFDVPLGPTQLTADISSDPDNANNLDFLATLPLPPKTVSFKAFGYLPVKAKVYFTQVGPVTGKAIYDTSANSFSIDSDASYVVTLRDVYVGGKAAKVGDNCQTRYPLNLHVTSGSDFDLFGGGNLTSTYDIGKFNNCRTSTDLVNVIVPSNGNTLTLKLGSLSIVDPDAPAAKRLVKKFAARK